jgi:Zn-finger protein
MDGDRKEVWRDKEYSFFSHRECEYFPCHDGVNTEDFNCLFCYCPLYALGDKCGGTFSFTERGYKNCMGCTRPHERGNYGEIIAKYPEIAELIKRQNG